MQKLRGTRNGDIYGFQEQLIQQYHRPGLVLQTQRYLSRSAMRSFARAKTSRPVPATPVKEKQPPRPVAAEYKDTLEQIMCSNPDDARFDVGRQIE